MAPTKKYTEEELVSMLRMGSEPAFSFLYDNYAAALNGIICRLVDDSQLAEDILQECFVKIWNNFSQYDPIKGRLFTWMVNLTRNQTIDTLRSKGFKKQHKISGDENFVSNNEDKTFSPEKFDTIGLNKKVDSLKPDFKNLIDLAYYYGYTQDEISREMNIPLGTVKTRMRSAINELRKIFQNT